MAAGSGDIVVGLIDPAPPARQILGIPVLGGDDVIAGLRSEGVSAAVIALGNNGVRQRFAATLRGLGFALPTVIHPSAFVSPSSQLGEGVVVMAGAVVGTAAAVGPLAIINTGACIDHDNILGIAAHVAPGCALAGNVIVGDRALVGVGSAIRPGIQIGADAVVGAGSAVVKDVAPGDVVGGSPARPLRQGSGR